ncbi:MAG: hypothetical protein QOG20_6462, partial [Pseudonocardiales bacterium]|nr:hypothetical protein [Pseudonocardiales bacterium]
MTALPTARLAGAAAAAAALFLLVPGQAFAEGTPAPAPPAV